MQFLHLFIKINPKMVLSTSVSHYILAIYEPHSLLRYIVCINQILLLTNPARLGHLTGFLEHSSEILCCIKCGAFLEHLRNYISSRKILLHEVGSLVSTLNYCIPENATVKIKYPNLKFLLFLGPC
jgi:hypothetical protein